MNEELELELRRRDFHRFIIGTFQDFIDGWVYEDLCSRLQKFMQDIRLKKSPRLIICLPPRLFKSQSASVRFPLYCLLNNPQWEIIVSSYSQSLVNRFSRVARALLESHPYILRLWPHIRLAQDHAAVEEWAIKDTTNKDFIQGGTYRAVGKGGSITGAGADCLVIDDPLKDFEEADSANARAALWDWYSSTARTRLTPGGGILLVTTRWHPDDLVGRVEYEEKHNEDADKWEKIDYQAIAEKDEPNRKAGESLLPGRWSEKDFLKIKNSIAPRWWDALYQQRPVAPGGNLFKEKHFRRFLACPELHDFDKLIQVWDLRFGKSQAKSSSFVVGWIIGKMQGSFFVLDEARGRWSYAESRSELKKLTVKWPQAITKLVEKKANGDALESDLEGQIPGILLYNPRGDKFQRAERILPLVEAGNVWFPDDSTCNWAKDAIHELTVFPRGNDDDRVDVLSMGLAYLLEQEEQMQTVYAL